MTLVQRDCALVMNAGMETSGANRVHLSEAVSAFAVVCYCTLVSASRADGFVSYWRQVVSVAPLVHLIFAGVQLRHSPPIHYQIYVTAAVCCSMIYGLCVIFAPQSRSIFVAAEAFVGVVGASVRIAQVADDLGQLQLLLVEAVAPALEEC